jgi:hypothetical protein
MTDGSDTTTRHPSAGWERVRRVERHRAEAQPASFPAGTTPVLAPVATVQVAFAFAPEPSTPASRRRSHAEPPARWQGHDQLALTLGIEHDEVTPPIPTSYGECKAPAHQALMAQCGGTCPIIRCRHHVALWVRDRAADASDDDRIESVKIEGGVARGRTARGTRALTKRGALELAELAEDLADRMFKLAQAEPKLAGIQSLCSLDYADRWRLTPLGIRRILGLRPRRMSKMLSDAAEELDIARARMRRKDAAAKAQEHQRKTGLVQLRKTTTTRK